MALPSTSSAAIPWVWSRIRLRQIHHRPYNPAPCRRKTGGQVLFNGKEVYDMTGRELRNLRTKMQIIFQDPFSSLSPRLPVGEIIGEAVREHNLVPKNEFDDYIDQVMDDCGLQPYHRPATRTSSPAASASVSALPVRWP